MSAETYSYTSYSDSFGLEVVQPGQRRLGVVLAVHAPSRAAARRAFAAVGAPVSDTYLRDYGGNWGTDHPRAEVIRSRPGIVFAQLEDSRNDDWIEVPS